MDVEKRFPIRWPLTYFAGGCVFWLPSIGIHAIRGHHFGGSFLDLLGVTILPAYASWATLEGLVWKRSGQSRRGIIALWMLLGIWTLGPLCMMTGWSFSGGQFDWDFAILGVVQFFPVTFTMSLHDGSLPALALVTICFLVMGVMSWSMKVWEFLMQPNNPLGKDSPDT